jgi:DNA processing protein
MTKNFELYRLQVAGATPKIIRTAIDHQEDNQTLVDVIGMLNPEKSHDILQEFHVQNVDKLWALFSKYPSFSILDDAYPVQLAEIYDAPILLYYSGNLELLTHHYLGFVGSRDTSLNGIQSVQSIVKNIAPHFGVISGLAKGIDTASHLAAIKANLPTIAVIGSGLDISYPRENRDLQNYLMTHQLVLSEYPPGQAPLRYHFPMRNRIIAGLSRGIVVTEAKLQSGSLITCERAMEEGRDVFAIPGSILDGRSNGCHHLIQQGAKLVFRAEDILEEYL